MAKITCKAAQLHTPLFLAGSNLGDKLNPTNRTGLKLEYSRVDQELTITYNGAVAHVPSANVASYTPGEPEVKKLVTATPPTTAEGFVKAQVSTPMDAGFKR